MQEKNFRNLLDALTDTSVYVIEESSHRLLFVNRRCKELGRGRAELGRKCHEVWPEVCANCPLDALGDGDSSHIVCYDPLMGGMIDLTANRALWEDRIPAVVIMASPHRLKIEEQQGLENIERIYAESLATVFGECIIANLTEDFYLNCQKNKRLTAIPEQGCFSVQNQNYARATVHPEDLAEFNAFFSREALLRRFEEGGKQIGRRLRRMMEDGPYHMVNFIATRIQPFSDNACWCILTFRDIHQEYLQEQARNLEMTQLATAARGAYEMLIAVNLTQNSYRMMEYDRFHTKQAAESGTFDELIRVGSATVHPDFREEFVAKFSRKSLLDAFAREERTVQMELRQMGDDGVYHWNFTQVVRVESAETDDVLQITMSKCIDQERRQQEAYLDRERRAKILLEEALQKAEGASRAKNDFLSRMSHDIRTPMNAIMGLASLARQHLEDPARLEDYLRKIESAGGHLLSLINEVLDVSKIESGVLRLEEGDFDLRGLVKDVLSIVQPAIERKGQRLTVRIPPEAQTLVRGDAARLRQILVNLLDNASKYTQNGGKIAFSVEELKRDERLATYRFVVEDEGIGMKPEYLAHVFEPFSRAEESPGVGGSGLGLAIVHSLVTMMGGTIDVESAYRQGSRFTVTLCLGEGARPPEETGAEETAVDLRGMRMLLAEDNILNQQIAVEMLGLLGIQVDVADDGRQALEAVLSHPPFYYDTVLMDIQMPVMGGYEAAQCIRASGMPGIGALPIIALTANAFAEDVKQARLAGMDAHLPKPISVEALRDTLVRLIQRRPPKPPVSE